MDKLAKTISHALGYYMHARLCGRDGEVQLRRLRRLQKAYESLRGDMKTNMQNEKNNMGLYEESFELLGARKLLSKLQGDYQFSMVPSVPMKCRSKVTGNEGYDYFPLPAKYRKMAGEGMMRFLLESKDNVRRYLYNDCKLYCKMITDAKGKVTRIDIYTE